MLLIRSCLVHSLMLSLYWVQGLPFLLLAGIMPSILTWSHPYGWQQWPKYEFLLIDLSKQLAFTFCSFSMLSFPSSLLLKIISRSRYQYWCHFQHVCSLSKTKRFTDHPILMNFIVIGTTDIIILGLIFWCEACFLATVNSLIEAAACIRILVFFGGQKYQKLGVQILLE